MDETTGQLLPVDRVGEVVVRGPNVMREYENNPEANARGFSNGWFRTGDQGVLDADGYLRLTGRLKEVIIARAKRSHRWRSKRCCWSTPRCGTPWCSRSPTG